MGKSTLVDDAINFAEAVLAADPKNGFEVKHFHKYFDVKGSRTPLIDENRKNQIIYTGPGKARVIEIKDAELDPRVGLFPQHNSIGDFPENFEIIPSLKLDLFQNLSTVEQLEQNGFYSDNAVLTKKKIARVQEQFANLSPQCFEGMMCLHQSDGQRDFAVWVYVRDDGEVVVAYINPELEVTQFFQSYKMDDYGQVYDVKHVVCEMGMPVVINQTVIDKYDNIRNIAHVGVTGSKKHSYYNSLERYDDGSLVWTSSDYKNGKNNTGSAVLFDDGSISLLDGSDKHLAKCSARNLGAEAIDEKTSKWKGEYSAEGCVCEVEDIFVVRRDYKAQVRKQVGQIVDGACIPGLTPIFFINI